MRPHHPGWSQSDQLVVRRQVRQLGDWDLHHRESRRELRHHAAERACHHADAEDGVDADERRRGEADGHPGEYDREYVPAPPTEVNAERPHEAVEGGKYKKMYRITDSGKAAFLQWAEEPIVFERSKQDHLAKIFFYEFIPKETAIGNLKDLAHQVESVAKELTGQKSEKEREVDIYKYYYRYAAMPRPPAAMEPPPKKANVAFEAAAPPRVAIAVPVEAEARVVAAP